MPTQAEALFQRWKADREAAFAEITAQIGNPNADLVECEWLDYKVGLPLWFRDKADYPTDKRKEGARKILSQMISAFANVSGGLLIWGVDAPNKKPAKRSYVQDVQSLHDICERAVFEVCDPPVSGVLFLELPDPADSPKGLLIVYIPESTHKPHRATIGERTFWQRTQDSCVPIVSSMLRTMFHPKVAPILEVVAQCTMVDSRQQFDHARGSIKFSVCNAGNGSAANLFLRWKSGIGGGVVEKIRFSNHCWDVGLNSFSAMFNRPLHPGELVEVGVLALISDQPSESIRLESFRLEVQIFAKDAEPTVWYGCLSPSEIEAAFKSLKDEVAKNGQFVDFSLPMFPRA